MALEVHIESFRSVRSEMCRAYGAKKLESERPFYKHSVPTGARIGRDVIACYFFCPLAAAHCPLPSAPVSWFSHAQFSARL
jgi:hypothetical protein